MAQAAYNQANTGTVLAQSAFNYANTISSSGTSIDSFARTTANNAINNVSATNGKMQSAYNQANSASSAASSASFASGTRLAFAQASAPTGWTQDTSDNADNRMFRVVNTTGGSVGGSYSPILNNVVPAHTHGITTGTESADHAHGGNTGYVSNDHAHVFGGDDQVASQGGFGVDSGFDYDAISNTSGGGVRMYTYGITANHYHGFSTDGRNAAHTHSGTTDNGSSQTNWTPRYIDMIICSKN